MTKNMLRTMKIKQMKLMKKRWREAGAQNSSRRFIRGKTNKYAKEKDALAKHVLEYKEENANASKSN